jgi:uncharacterized protein with ParB-like and HNH nuclease domain
MSKIDGFPKTVRELLEKKKYSIDYYQREYTWGKSHISELIDDLESKFLSEYREGHQRSDVENYAHYYLGSIIVSHKNNRDFIVDGQQRLTSLTLLLIYLNHLQNEKPANERVDVSDLIYSERYGGKSFNIDVPERIPCIESLFSDKTVDLEGQPESVRNIAQRYEDIVEMFPDTLKNHTLPYFIDWLIDNVDMIEIVAYSDDDAYSIFETVNDRGVKLTPTEMLKGYLLANIDDQDERDKANSLWRSRLLQFLEQGEPEVEFFKAWLRSQYADKMRERERGAQNQDFEKIATGYHKWVRDEKKRIGLDTGHDFRDFILKLFDQYSTHYLMLRKAAKEFTPSLEYLFYNEQNDFTLQYPLILAAIRENDSRETVQKKARLLAGYIDIFIARRIANFRTLAYSSIVYTMFNLMKEIRRLEIPQLADLLKKNVQNMPEKFDGIKSLYVHQQNRSRNHFLLARITYHIEKECGVESSLVTYISRSIQKPFEIEHIWGDNFEEYADEFSHSYEFEAYRNRFGGLILLPRGFNQSLGKGTYGEKLDAYFGQNLLTKSLHPNCYVNNPSFLHYLERSHLPFKPYPTNFTKQNLDERQELYRLICEEIWSTKRFDAELE